MLSALARAISSCGSEISAGVSLFSTFGGRIAKHPLGADVEDLNDAHRVGGDAREVGAVEDRTLQGPGLEQRLFRLLERSVVGALGDADPRPRLVVSISHGVGPDNLHLSH